MTISKVSAAESHVRLMQGIGAQIQHHTMTSPMSVEDVVAVLGVCAGAAIANGKSPLSRRELRQVMLANLDNAMQTADATPQSALILPPGVA